MRGPKVQYAETYKAPGLKIAPIFHPICTHATGHVVDEAFILKAGKLADGREFHIIRIHLKQVST